MAAAASSEPADGELLAQSPFSKGEWLSEYSVDIGYDHIYPCFETDANRGFEKLAALQILATAYCATEHETLLEMEPGAFLSKWEALIGRGAVAATSRNGAGSRQRDGDGDNRGGLGTRKRHARRSRSSR